MDSFVVNNLSSGNAWVLVGSGPSNAMGYPSWQTLAEVGLSVLREENPVHITEAERALARGDIPKVFECAWQHLGEARLLQVLRGKLRPTRRPDVYDLIAKWPVAVYLTTNWDDEIHNALVRQGECYMPYTNSEAHMSLLHPDFRGAIFKLHGDLSETRGLVMTSSQYQAICDGDAFEYWRTKMTSVFQMTPVVVIGHSLTDENVRHVLKAARLGGGVDRPVCWIAPNVSFSDRQKYLNEMRIRVISYHHDHGDNHINLVRLLEQLSVFVPSRVCVKMPRDTTAWIQDGSSNDAAIPALYVYNSLSTIHKSGTLQAECLVAALKSSLPGMYGQTFSIKDALARAGLPNECNLPKSVLDAVSRICVEQKLLRETEKMGFYVVVDDCLIDIKQKRDQFMHLEERFKKALTIRARQLFANLSLERATCIAQDIRNALVGYFRSGGLTFATTLFDEQRTTALPSCILDFTNKASHKYDDLLSRQVFSCLSVDIFTQPTEPSREFLGRMSQGFFIFHSLGVLGEVAVERIRSARDSVWLLDSDALIQALARNAPTEAVYKQTIQRLVSAKIRFFSLSHLALEAWNHFLFAQRLIKENGEDSPSVWLAANGDTPYDRSNQFLLGFVHWRRSGGKGGWTGYQIDALGTASPTKPDMDTKLGSLGIELVEFSDWPGFSSERDYADYQEYVQKITPQRCKQGYMHQDEKDDDVVRKAEKKAEPEAEATVVILRERSGDFNILSNNNVKSPAWFISNTSILNSLVNVSRITWPSDGFLRFAEALPTVNDSVDSNLSFDILLSSIAETGIPLVARDEIARVFSTTIDQSMLIHSQQVENYARVLEEKYGEPSSDVVNRITPVDRPLAVLQLAHEAAERLSEQNLALERRVKQAESALQDKEAQLEKLGRFKQKRDEKKAKGKKDQRRLQSQKGMKKKHGTKQ